MLARYVRFSFGPHSLLSPTNHGATIERLHAQYCDLEMTCTLPNEISNQRFLGESAGTVSDARGSLEYDLEAFHPSNASTVFDVGIGATSGVPNGPRFVHFDLIASCDRLLVNRS